MPRSETPPIRGVIETCLYVDDLDQAAEFYQEVLGLPLVSRVESRHVFFRLGAGMLLLFNPDQSNQGGDVPAHGARGAGHVAFCVGQTDFATWRRRLAERGVAVEQEIEWGQSGGHSIYFRDPAGNSLELTNPETWGGVS